MPSSKRPVRIAHAYGNSLDALERALAADNDMIETDIWYRAGQILVRHERRLGPLPLLGDRRMAGHALGPMSLRLGRRYFLRPDVKPFRLDDLLDAAGGRRRLLLHFKGTYTRREIDTFSRLIT